MSSTGSGAWPPNFMLTPQQQSLLFAAIDSNKQQLPGSSSSIGLNPNSLQKSPQSATSAYQESPFLDNYDYDVGDSSFDFSFADGQTMIDDLPETAKSDSTGDNDGSENNEKRSHPEDDEDEDGNDAKRRESTDRAPKKPGRKPLTSEPTSKRKAQNRAAQRAFRERKEKHLKDLETKVEELEKASEDANHENSKLRAQVERMTTELQQYKQKLAVMGNPKALSRDKVPFGSPAINNLSDVNFQFNFPKFGQLPGPPAKQPQRSVSQPISPLSQQQFKTSSPANNQNFDRSVPRTDAQFKEDLANLGKFSGVLTPSMSSSRTTGSRGSLDSANQYNLGTTSSPSASSNSNIGPSSSCGTSPEPFTQSPLGFKPIDTMTTIGEEQPSMTTDPFSQFSNVDFSNTNFDWLAQQNGGQFDPQLFGDYREPQENVLSNPAFEDFFNDAVDSDFFTPYNMGPSLASPALPKKNLIDAIDAQKEDVNDQAPGKNIHCQQIWDKLQSCEKTQSGEFDLDGLCLELTKKAKCSGSGPVVGENDFNHIFQKYIGKGMDRDCLANSLNIQVDKNVKSNGVGQI